MKTTIKRIIACVVFCALVVALLVPVNDIVISKKYNRYYMLQQAVEELDGTHDVQVYGACHSYTSFQAAYFEEKYGVSAFDFGNPGEIVPVTYLQMLEHFKKDVPTVALVEIWGINAYDTYTAQEEIFESYMPMNIEALPLSLQKIEVINDFSSLDNVNENFALAKYKDRILNMELTAIDFDYSFEKNAAITSPYMKTEMEMRLSNNGFCEMPMRLDSSVGKKYNPYMPVPDYAEQQATVSDDETMALEPDMLKYVDKIIELCEKNDVELIFYRAPYVSTENELKKANWFANYCAEQKVGFIDLEKAMTFDVDTDFLDYHHLNEAGAIKATDYLAQQILPLM